MKFRIEGSYYGNYCFPSLNNYIQELGRNPKAGGRFKKEYVRISTLYIRKGLGSWTTNNPVILHYRFGEPDKGRKRDVMNVFGFADKVIEDTLRDLKVFPDDNPKYVTNCTHDFEYVKEPYIEVEIEEVDR